MRLAVIADDLTGACDSGVQLVRAGYRTAVAFLGAPLPPREDLDAAVADTDSRPLAAHLARERVAEAGRELRDARIVFKKLDSTLRGPVAAELETALESTGRRAAVVAPAFPAAGRTTRRGVQMLRGVPVHETEFARDPRTPVLDGSLPSLLGGTGAVVRLGIRDLEDAASVRRAVEENRWVIADAERDAHLEALVRAIPEPSAVLWAGSAGLALALGRVYPGPRPGAAGVCAGPARRVLVVVGSASGVAREQRGRLLAEPGIEGVAVELSDGGAASDAARAALAAGRSVVLGPPPGEADPEEVIEALAGVAADLEGLFDALVLTGGETAVGVARRLGGRGILLGSEVEPGVPAGVLIGLRPYPVVTKAGGFGGPETLLRAVRVLRGEGGEGA